MGWLDAIATFLAGLFASSENKKVKAVRDATVKYCGFLPTVETVLALFAANPAVNVATIIASAAVRVPSPAHHASAPSVRRQATPSASAALPASDYVAASDQRAQVLTFIDSAVAACRSLLGA